MKKLALLALAVSIVVFAENAWRTAHWLREPAGEAAGVGAEQAAVERVLERTLRESRTGVETAAVLVPPSSVERPETVAAQPLAPVVTTQRHRSAGPHRDPCTARLFIRQISWADAACSP